MKDSNCGYCMRGELLDAFGIYICDLSVSSPDSLQGTEQAWALYCGL